MSSEELHAIELLGRVPYGRLATSMRALPILTVARHIVIEGRVVLRMHSSLGYHDACNGTVVAYGADNCNAATSTGSKGLWSVQFTGPAEIIEPTCAQRELFGPRPAEVNGEPFAAAYLRLDPHFVTVHTLDFHANREGRQHSVI
ncbi:MULTISPECIES: pyridoxamine 5'-phosphate oxidase family protein [unclassified Streptomyces]|uniref:pyridoxamine 5'-phosphate oxidase family protein n=1 Tax=unclassified Streptomyces TaxID=2593676 RepID=UPI0020337123|nr:pyridoxamine 5'-phosphate oxidase family protein [Streptomyces sp. RKAG290]MCM2413004.1 pyridoxamine 5'-phosphate oxidase family protein [Streptomyces sp. RKAG290]